MKTWFANADNVLETTFEWCIAPLRVGRWVQSDRVPGTKR